MDKRFVDPVCGMVVTPETAADSAEFDGQTYYFCSPGSRTAFESSPDRYIRPASENTM